MNIANRPLNYQAIALEEVETEIRKVVKDEYFSNATKAAIDKKIFAVVTKALKQIKVPVLRDAARRSLLNFYNSQYKELLRSFSFQMPVLSAVMLLNGRTPSGREIQPTAAQKQQAIQTLTDAGYDNSRLMGVPLQRFSEDYIKEHVTPALDRLAQQYAKDPDDVGDRNSLRNRAEMEVRYQGHMDELANLKSRGVKLVICSAHADCSDRCAGYQGKVFSLDGTSGRTDDGRSYRPLEEATDVPYETKAGKKYKNGLLGFNCRHYLVPYKSGYRFPKPNPTVERVQYAITERQRQLESNVRKWRIRAIESKGQDEKAYAFARKKAIAWNKEYIAFSKAHDRAYYPSRTKLI